MPHEPDVTQTMAHAEALIEEALRSVERSGSLRQALQQQRETELRRFARAQVSLANQRPALPAEEIASDPATVLARRVRRRRVIV
jgi:hypothetical protein